MVYLLFNILRCDVLIFKIKKNFIDFLVHWLVKRYHVLMQMLTSTLKVSFKELKINFFNWNFNTLKF